MTRSSQVLMMVAHEAGPSVFDDGGMYARDEYAREVHEARQPTPIRSTIPIDLAE